MRNDPVNWPPAPRDGNSRRVLFINPPSVPYNALVRTFAGAMPAHQTVAMPMGILYLAATLERDLPGIEIDVIDIAKRYREACDGGITHATFEEFCRFTLCMEGRHKPDIIGISVLFSTAHKSTIRIAEVCKGIWPDVPVIVGGMHATNSAKQLLESQAVDYVFKGEGESVIADLVINPSAAIPGVVSRDGDGGAAPLIYDLDTIPYPAWHLLDMPGYVHAPFSRARDLEDIEVDGVATIVTTRGCPFHCTFCASWTVHGREMRYRSAENVVEELRLLHYYHSVNLVVPEDDLFTVKKQRFIGLCHAIADEFQGRMHFQFPNGLSVNTLDYDVLAAMKRMGMRVANIAIESGSEYVQRKIIKKNVDLERARRVVADCHKLGLFVRCYFILGFPGETKKHMQETIDFAANLDADWALFNTAAPLSGTEMYHQLIERGDIDQSFNWDEAFFNERKYDTAEISAKELKLLAYEANLRVNFFENYNLRVGNYERAESLFRDIIRAYPGHLAAYICLSRALLAQGQTEEARKTLSWADLIFESGNPMAVEQVANHPHLFQGYV